ncbi:hypothetical protein IK146_00625 [Candidatus Saccharibacteria bacterium]|nr:hypothetical protein [Candidatus Saccharibacteria bacterium]
MRRIRYGENEEATPASPEATDGNPNLFSKRVRLFDAQEMPPELPDSDEPDVEPLGHLPITPEPASEPDHVEPPEPAIPPRRRRRVLADRDSIAETTRPEPKLIAKLVSVDPLKIVMVSPEELEESSSSEFGPYRLKEPRSFKKKKSPETSGNESGSRHDSGPEHDSARHGRMTRHNEISRQRSSGGIRRKIQKLFGKRTPETMSHNMDSSVREEAEPMLRPRPIAPEEAPSKAPVSSREAIRRRLVIASEEDIGDYGSF